MTDFLSVTGRFFGWKLFVGSVELVCCYVDLAEDIVAAFARVDNIVEGVSVEEENLLRMWRDLLFDRVYIIQTEFETGFLTCSVDVLGHCSVAFSVAMLTQMKERGKVW